MAKTTTTSRRTLALVVLAAGKGKRMRSASQKVLTPVCGKPALWHVIRAARAARPDRIVIVVGKQADLVRAAVGSWGVKPEPVFVEQGELRGTGHAVLAAERAVGRVDDVLVANGDLDPVTPEDVRALIRTHRRTRSAASVLTAELDEPAGYGRVIRDGERLVRIAEHADATRAERAIREVATNWVAFRRKDLYGALPLVGRDNRQGEHYLHDVYPILADKGERVSALLADTGGAMGLNSRAGLAAVERVVRARINEEHMAGGVTIADPAATYIDVGVRIASDATILPLTFLEGDTRIGAGCVVGPGSRILDSRIGDGSEVWFSVVLGSRIAKGVKIGPWAYIRPGTVMRNGSKAGAHVEIKSSTIGEGSKVPHLSYVGDAVLGRNVNVGAGSVFANYDGYEKRVTVIGDDARIGSDTMLVAPVRVGKGAVTGAGSVITKDVPAGALAVERGEQKIVKDYRERKDAQRRGRGGT
ncbi:MAG: bifunctional UDP-N-acetylglucosamine diphosphorylase/glucosamine-1-phosphate N-acetyltransferase GlmU [Actinobacteria bacterium]|nr:bifunctional UDP-N-acetylglucosamine diphosphorylase/glucosamine-1-phosphate N-acetyltransferase GlmU [Actinomycetota bacterium]